jgi:4-amino-4-deoxy-L-arabinose transferase-like glycosyltransferase
MPTPHHDWEERLSVGAVLALSAALLAAPSFGHNDDTDAQLYQVVARKMAERGAWLDPSYLDGVYPHFREHLPFGLWPFAVGVRAFGEGSLPFIAGLWCLATVFGTFWVGRRLWGPWPALAAALVLATTEGFFLFGARARLDPLLVMLSNAAAVPFLIGTQRRWALTAGAAAAACAVLVKGPFGLVPWVASALARSVADRSWRPLLQGILGSVAAAIPLAAFLWTNQAYGDGTWWHGYGQGQLLASAAGRRSFASSVPWWFPFRSMAGRFWPGLPLLLAGAVQAAVAWRSPIPGARAARVALVFVAAMLAALCVPKVKEWNHQLIAYPGFALLAGSSLLNVSRWLERPRVRTAFAIGTAVVALGAWILAPTFQRRALSSPPCVGSADFAPWLDGIPAGSAIWIVSSPTKWRTLASLAAERRLEPYPTDRFPLGPDSATRVAQVEEALFPAEAARDWEELARARGWLLLRRR